MLFDLVELPANKSAHFVRNANQVAISLVDFHAPSHVKLPVGRLESLLTAEFVASIKVMYIFSAFCGRIYTPKCLLELVAIQ